MTLYWDPSPILVHVPGIHWPIYWYGLCFALGLLASAYLCKQLLENNYFSKISVHKSRALVDHLFLYSAIGLLLGARLVHVFFYDWNYYQANPTHIFSIWEGGLASHGGAIGLLLGTFLFYKRYKVKEEYTLPLLSLFDILALSTFPAACAIRIGNFFNQEIVGIPTSLPIGILFGHPLGMNETPVPRHPVQLYEALAYLVIGLLLFFKRNSLLKKKGLGVGLVLVSFFSARFFLEFLKSAQTASDLTHFFSTGQALSLPFIAVGLIITWWSLHTSKKRT